MNPLLSDTLLPNEPRIADPLQHTLTERFLLPALPGLRALLEELRARVDPVLSARVPARLGQPYPRSQGLHITQAVHEAIRRVDAGTLPPRAADGFAALAAFHAHGGSLRHVWGALRGTHFHHAFLFGTLLVDVAADAIAGGGGKVGIVPFRQARFTPVRDHRHYALLARSALHATVYPNHVLPTAAPYAPLIVLVPGGSVRIESDAAYMHELALASGFTSSAEALKGPAMPPDLFRLIADTLGKADIATAADTVQGQRDGLALCARYRDGHRRAGDLGHVRALELLGKANSLLATLQVAVSQQRAA
ncbi:hypothetical protein [Pseudoduganella albidiflava]|uniref:Uncharacterized protein n=1 Tax=Pseudoduganella albidiflava TaxID=321983 RepID=A0A411X4L1_9BURK|nr:hypothetical protein [Pseudoduganella albidiflava]QBI03823.1 hypothetical protein EYF70_25660 [Pseudoduganella albidiflava]GGY70445.1 hypothetical protein GCM10007387_60450 [Pseudoduganella albidiflava]